MIASLLLGGVAINAYREKHKETLLYVCVAFIAFAVKESILTVNIIFFRASILTGLSHVLNLVILALFFTGMVKQ